MNSMKNILYGKGKLADRRSGQQEVIKSKGSSNFVDKFKLTLALKTVRIYSV